MLIKKLKNTICTPQSGRGNVNLLKPSLIIFCLLFSINAVLPSSSLAATYYVDKNNPSANDTNPGTEAHPWKTLTKAGNTAVAGDTVLAKAGTYTNKLYPINSGAQGSLITFKNYPSESPVIDGQGASTTGVDLSYNNGRDYIRIEGFKITGWNYGGFSFSTNYGATSAENIEIVNCDIYGNNGPGMWVHGQNTLIENNHIYNNGESAILIGMTGIPSINITVRGNNVHDNYDDGMKPCVEQSIIENNTFGPGGYNTPAHSDGIQIEHMANSIIRNNVFRDYTQMIYISLYEYVGYVDNLEIYGNVFYNNVYYSSTSGTTPGIFIISGGALSGRYVNNVDIHSNTFLWTGLPAVWIMQTGSPVTGITIRNNIFFDTYLNTEGVNPAEIDSDYNLFFDTPNDPTGVIARHLTDGVAWVNEGSHSIIGQDPNFVNYTVFQSWDVHLNSTSPAKNAGDPALATVFNLPTPFQDIDGNARPQGSGYDIGAYEYVISDTTPPSIPQNLTAQVISDRRIDLSWQASTDNESAISYYNVYRDGGLSPISQPTSTSYSDTSLSPSTSYSYEVSAVNTAGLESGRSNAAQATTLADTTPPSVVSVNAYETSLEILFDESMELSSAQNTGNYAITGGISVISASLSADLMKVTLTTSAHAEGNYTLTIANVRDVAGNQITQTTENYQYSAGLVGYWKFDDGSGSSAVDSSVNNNTGTLINGPTWATGRIGGALSFDGINDAVQIGTSDFNVSEGTVSLWIYANNFSSSHHFLFGHLTQPWSNRIQLYTDDAAGNLDLGLGNSHTRDTNIEDMDTQRWYNIALSWDGTNYVVYVDGTAKATGTYTGLSTLTTYADIGNNGNSSDRSESFNGLIDEVRFYNRALNASEILSLYNVINDNNEPVLNSIGNKTVNENVLLTFTVDANDADGDTITYSALNLPNGASFTGQAFSWTPGFDQAGTYYITFIASDAYGQDNETITVTVNNVNRVPVLDPIGDKSVNENNTISFSVSASDADNDTITYTEQNLPIGAVYVSQTFTWTPDYSQAGTHTITFIASDGQDQDSETITITVNNVNRGPVFTPMSDQAVYTDDSLTFTVNAVDPDGDTLTYSASGLPYGANFNIATQLFSWTPSSGQVGSYDVTFIASDSQDQDSMTITITVSADVLAPNVTNCLPDDGAVQVPLNNLIILHVVDTGKGVDAGSVIIEVDNNIVYTGDTDIYSSAYGKCRRSGAKEDYKYVYQAYELFDFDQTVIVAVNAEDLAGNVMTEYSYSFKTEMFTFGKNKKVSSASDDFTKGMPAAVTDSSGDIWTVWHAGPAGSRDIYAGKLQAGEEAFSNSVRLTNDIADQYNAAIAIDASDKLYIVWQDNRRGNWDIYILTSTDGVSWSNERRITDSNDNQVNPVIAVDDSTSKKVYVVWEDNRGGNQDIYAASSSDDFMSKVISAITSDSSDQTEPAIAIDSVNTAYVVWTDARNSSSDIYGAASNNSWTNVPIVNTANNQSSPAIAAEAVGSILHLLWVDDSSGSLDIFHDTSNGLSGSPLAGNTIVDDTSGANQLQPVIAVTGSTGNNLKVFACWQDYRSADIDLCFAEVSFSIGTNVLVGDDNTNTDQSYPVMSIDSDGYPYLIWADSRNVNSDIYFAGCTFIESNALASKDISASSGDVVGTDLANINSEDDVSVTLPPGVYSCDLKITISRVKNPSEFSKECFSLPYDFGPSGVDFDQPVTVTIPYSVSSAGNSASAYWYDPLTGTLSQQGITNVENIEISSTLHALRFQTVHFSMFFVADSGDDGGGVISIGGSSGGGGGCSMSPDNQGSVIEFLIPYIGLALVMTVLKLRDVRSQRS